MSKQLENKIIKMASAALGASRKLALVSASERNKALKKMASALKANKNYLMRENKKDLVAGKKAKLSSALLDRLALNDKRIKAEAHGKHIGNKKSRLKTEVKAAT